VLERGPASRTHGRRLFPCTVKDGVKWL
jgi:hypothetical protein